MKIDILTLFPEALSPFLHASILGRAIEAGLLDVRLTNPRTYTLDPHRRVDDYPYGGGAGMVMQAQPIVDAVEAVDGVRQARRIYLSPRGRRFDQRIAEELAGEDHLLLLCGHYEGVDERALEECGFEELSIGDFVLTGGELGALVVVDAVSRLLPGVLGSDQSPEDESFTTGLLEYPQYTRPDVYRGRHVPEVLLGGNHADILAWRREQSLRLTRNRRPDLLGKAPLDDADRAMLSRIEKADAACDALERSGISARVLPDGLAQALPRRFILTFVSEATRKAARKVCLSGRRHAGCLWRAFADGFVPCLRDADADACLTAEGALRLLYLPKAQALLELEQPIGTPIDLFDEWLLFDAACRRVYARWRTQDGAHSAFAQAAISPEDLTEKPCNTGHLVI